MVIPAAGTMNQLIIIPGEPVSAVLLPDYLREENNSFLKEWKRSCHGENGGTGEFLPGDRAGSTPVNRYNFSAGRRMLDFLLPIRESAKKFTLSG
jgi:hypothetical protein